MRLCRFVMLWSVLFAAFTSIASAQEWTRYRGPNGTGKSDCTTIPTTFTAKDYLWKTKLAGVGHASVVAWGDKLFTISASEDATTRHVVCLDATNGKLLWQKDFNSASHHKHLLNSFASSTPAVDAERVYVSWSTPEEYTLLALYHDGREAWRLNLGGYVSQHSCGTSPIVYGDMLILCNEQDGLMKGENDKEGVSFLIAVSAKDGSQRWRSDRKNAVVTYSTPCVYQQPGKPEVLLFNSQGHGISGVDPLTGKTLWELSVLKRRSVSSPVFYKDLVFATCGSGGGGNYVSAVKVGATPEEAYQITDNAPYVPSLLVDGDLLFLWGDKGIVSAAKAATGEQLWKERIGGKFWGSPILVNGYLYALAEDGTVVVLKAGDKYELVSKHELGEPASSTPSVAGGRMFLRSVSHIVAIGKK